MSDLIRRFNPPTLSRPNGFVHVAEAADSGLLFISGQVAYNAAGQVVGEGDLAVQTRQVMLNLQHALEAAGSGFDQVLKLTFFVRNLSEAAVATIREVRREFLPADALPASTMVGVASLARESLLLEVEAYALRRPVP